MATNNKIKVHLISVDKYNDNPLITKVIETINSYLLRNKGAISDYNLIKDIVERNCDALDEEVNQQLPVPLYLGLMGTVLGIILGLMVIDFDPDNFMNSVSGLVGSVKWAMGCSFCGLLLTTLLSAWKYRGAKAKLEEQKNELYTFIQIELLPQLSQDANSTILTMQAHLERFNAGFSENVNGFDDIMNRILQAFDSQVRLTEELRHMDIARVANLNSQVLVELRNSMTEFEKFNQYLNMMNTFVRKTAEVTDAVNNQLRRTDDIKGVVTSMEENIENNRLVMEKLQNFLQRVEAHNSLIQTAADIDDTLTNAIDELRRHVQEQIDSIRLHTTEASQDLDQLLNSERGHLDRLNKLDDLSKLSTLVQSVNSMKSSFEQQNQELTKQIKKLSENVGKMGNNQTITASVGVPPFVLWTVSILVSLAALFFIFNMIFGDNDNHITEPESIDSDSTLVEYVDSLQGSNTDSVPLSPMAIVPNQ